MNQTSTIFIAIAAMMAILNWVTVARGAKSLEYLSKPAATVAFLLTAGFLDVPHDAPWGWMLAALVLCLAGDVFLMLPRNAFIPGLSSFAVAQVLFTVSFATGDTRATRTLVGLVVVIPIAFLLARRIAKHMRTAGNTELIAPVTVYILVISAMAVGAVAVGSMLAIAGAAIFMVSDSLIAETRFVQPRGWHSVVIMVTYHLALAGLVLSLI